MVADLLIVQIINSKYKTVLTKTDILLAVEAKKEDKKDLFEDLL